MGIVIIAALTCYGSMSIGYIRGKADGMVFAAKGQLFLESQRNKQRALKGESEREENEHFIPKNANYTPLELLEFPILHLRRQTIDGPINNPAYQVISVVPEHN